MDMGETLRVAREQRGLSLDELSSKTKISTLALRAIEENDIQRLPGGIFLRGFLRAYAREVGLNVEDTVSRYVAQFEPRNAMGEESDVDLSVLRAALADAEPRLSTEPAGRTMSMLGVFAVIVLTIGVLAYVTLYQPQPPFETTIPPEQPDPVAFASPGNEPVTAGSEPAITSDELSATGSEPANTGSQTTATSSATATTGSEPAIVTSKSAITGTEPAAAVSKSAISGTEAANVAIQEPNVASASAGSALVLTIQTSGPCWVSAIVDGRTVVYRLMQADDQATIAGGNEVELRVGDPATFAFQINGAAGKALGPAGEVATVRITADNYQEFIAPAPTP
jgi:cytoskeleton protein RodZ